MNPRSLLHGIKRGCRTNGGGIRPVVSEKINEDKPTYPQQVGMPKIPGGSVCAASNVAVLLLLLRLL